MSTQNCPWAMHSKFLRVPVAVALAVADSWQRKSFRTVYRLFRRTRHDWEISKKGLHSFSHFAVLKKRWYCSARSENAIETEMKPIFAPFRFSKSDAKTTAYWLLFQLRESGAGDDDCGYWSNVLIITRVEVKRADVECGTHWILVILEDPKLLQNRVHPWYSNVTWYLSELNSSMLHRRWRNENYFDEGLHIKDNIPRKHLAIIENILII